MLGYKICYKPADEMRIHYTVCMIACGTIYFSYSTVTTTNSNNSDDNRMSDIKYLDKFECVMQKNIRSTSWNKSAKNNVCIY